MDDYVGNGVKHVTDMLTINQEYPFIAGFYESTIHRLILKYVPEDEQEELLNDMFTAAGRIVTEKTFNKFLRQGLNG